MEIWRVTSAQARRSPLEVAVRARTSSTAERYSAAVSGESHRRESGLEGSQWKITLSAALRRASTSDCSPSTEDEEGASPSTAEKGASSSTAEEGASSSPAAQKEGENRSGTAERRRSKAERMRIMSSAASEVVARLLTMCRAVAITFSDPSALGAAAIAARRRSKTRWLGLGLGSGGRQNETGKRENECVHGT